MQGRAAGGVAPCAPAPGNPTRKTSRLPHACLAAGLAVTLLAPNANAHPGHDDEAGPAERDCRRVPMDAVELPAPEVSITTRGRWRIIESNGIPGHATGEFPSAGNPNAIRPLQHRYRVPLEPVVADEPTPALPELGFALNGVVSDAGTGEF